MTTHVVIDLETWGTEPGSDIRSIGACIINPYTGWIAERGSNATFYLATDNPTRYGTMKRHYPLTRDPRTVQWWSEQSDEAQAAFVNPVDLRDALIRFSGWLGTMNDPNGLIIWGHGVSFDPVLLAAAYKALGFPIPWPYRAPRDTRTAFDMAGITDHSAWLHEHRVGTFHHALDDALCEGAAICAAYKRIRYNTDRRADAFYAGWDARDAAAPSINAVSISADDAYNKFVEGLK